MAYPSSNIKSKTSHLEFQLSPAQLTLSFIDLLGVSKFLKIKY